MRDSRSSPADESPLLSVIVPVKNEADGIVASLRRFAAWNDLEIIVSTDGSSHDASAVRAATVPGVRVLACNGHGRGATLAAGARAARGRFLLFLHADSRLTEPAVRGAMARLGGMVVAASFCIRLDSPKPFFRLLEAGINLRSEMGLPYGDQGLLIARDVYERAGGFRHLARCEDLDLVLRLRRLGRIAIAPGPCTTSTRRWDSEGVLRVTRRNLFALARFLLTRTVSEGVVDDVPADSPPRGDRGGEPAAVDRRPVRS